MLHPAYDLSFFEHDDEKDLKVYDVMLCDVVHGKPPFKPLYIGLGWFWYVYAIMRAAEKLQLPTTKGWGYRVLDGYPYLTAIRTTKEEAAEREPVFREQIKPFIEDFEGLWNPLKMELIDTYKAALKKAGIQEWDDVRKISNLALFELFLDFSFVINRKEAEYHMITLVAGNYINGLFQQMWFELFKKEAPIDPDFSRVMAGFEAQDTTVVREMWQLARKAVDMGLEEAFQPEDGEAVIAELEKTEKGREWMKAYKAFLMEHGWRCERMHAYDTPAWVEFPSLAIGRIKVLMTQESFAFDSEREKLIEKRKKAEEEVVGRLPAEQREWFKTLMDAAQKAGWWSEDHTYFCDFYVGALGHMIFSEIGRRLAANDCIDDPEDVYFLHPNDIRKTGIPMALANLRPYVERRKEPWQKAYDTNPPPFIGNIEMAPEILRSDPTLSVSTQHPIVREELKADLYGAAAAPGIIEGTARVIMDAKQLNELQEGEILVAPGTSAAWTVAFSFIKGLITDGGGALSHPVIMAREYGIPCVAGCLEATQKIKTGMRVKIDGDLGVVYLQDS